MPVSLVFECVGVPQASLEKSAAAAAAAGLAATSGPSGGKPLVGIIMGSDSDLATMKAGAQVTGGLGSKCGVQDFGAWGVGQRIWGVGVWGALFRRAARGHIMGPDSNLAAMEATTNASSAPGARGVRSISKAQGLERLPVLEAAGP